ncbi:MAG: hypothetical protein TECD_00254 [Hyphomicrobiaceae bacterium hypho_1]
MANKKDGSGKDNQKKGWKPTTSGVSPKKPNPIIELQANNVPDYDIEDIAENLKHTEVLSIPDKGKSTASNETYTTSKETADKKTKDESSQSTIVNSSSNIEYSKKKIKKPTSSNTSHVTTRHFIGTRILSLISYLFASIVGGAIVLFGARPLDEELKLNIIPPAKIPIELEKRLTVLENRPLIRPEDVTPVDTAENLSARINDLKKQLATHSALREKVDLLAEKVIIATQKKSSSVSVEQLDGIAERIVKLEMIIKNLVDATGPDGQPTTLAGLTSLSDKLSDLESGLRIEINELRHSITRDSEAQFSEIKSASETIQSVRQRIDKELSQLRNTTAQLELRAETLKLAQKNMAGTVHAMGKEVAEVSIDYNNFKTNINERLTVVARPSDVMGAIAPLLNRLTRLDNQLSQIISRENDSKANVQRVVMALQLGNLKRAIDRGGAFSTELQEVNKIVEGTVDLSPLKKFQTYGVPTIKALQLEFSKLAYTIINSAEQPVSNDLFGYLLKRAQSIVRLRRTNLPEDDNSVEAIVSRIEKLLNVNDLIAALNEVEKFPETSLEYISDWISKAKARVAVDQAIANIEQQLKSSLSSKVSNRG